MASTAVAANPPNVTPAPARRPVRVRRAALTALFGGVLFAALYAKALPCAFSRVTHHPCPGCGSTRAVLALLPADLHMVLRNNPLGPVMALLLGVLLAQTWLSILRWGDFRDVATG